MKSQTGAYVDMWWARLFGTDSDAVWRGVTARHHETLGDYTGWFVAWRPGGVHVSAPASAGERLLGRLAATDPDVLGTAGFWSAFASEVGGTLVGPATHLYLDEDPRPDPDVVAIGVGDAASLRPEVGDDEWWESGFDDDDVSHAFGLHEHGRLVAASSLSGFDGRPRDVGVLVAPDARGRHLVDRIGRTAASYAVRDSGLARWVARDGNRGSTAAAARLGFEPWCTQLAVRLPRPEG